MSVSITVRGSHESWHRPERGTVHLAVAMEGATKDSVYASASQTANAVAGQVTPLFHPDNGPVTWWSSDQVRTWSHRPWNKDGRQLPQVHHAGVDFHVKFNDFEALSRWLTAVAGLPGVTVGGIEWALTDDHSRRLTDEVRTAAVHDARDKAQAYADSLGLGLVRPVELADVGMLGNQPPAPLEPSLKMARMAVENGGGGEISLAPQDIVISAAVDARFVAD